MYVMVTGGTGFVGSHSVAALVAAGHRVRLLVRDESRVAPALAPLGVDRSVVDVARGDVTDPAAVAAAVSGCDAVLHAASVYSFDSRDRAAMRGTNVRGTEVVLDAAVRAGADPVVHVSTFGALLPAPGRVVSADSPVGRPRELYMATKAEADRVARRHQDAGAPVTITYPVAVLGPNDPHLGDQLQRLRNALLGLMPIWPSGGFPVCDVRDVAALHAAVMQPGQGARRLAVQGHYLSTRDYVRALRRVTGRRLPAVFLPARALLPLGLAVRTVQHVVPWHIPAEYGAIYVCACATRVEARELPAGVGARPVEQTMADAVRWLLAEGRISPAQAGPAILAARPGGRVEGMVA